MKDAMTSVDLRALAMELSSLREARVQKCYHIPPDELRLVLYSASAGGRLELLVEAGRRVHITTETRQAPQNPSGFAMSMRKSLSGARVLNVEQYDFDRILRIDAAREGEGASVIIELFAQGNVVIADESSRIIAALRTLRMRDRNVVRGETYVPPPAQLSPVDAGMDELAGALKSSTTDLVRTLATRLNMGGLYAEEVCLRAGIDKNSSVADIGPGDVKELHRALQETFAPLLKGELRPQVVFKDGKPVDVVALDLKAYEGFKSEPYPTFSEALEAYYSAVTASGDAAKSAGRKKGAGSVKGGPVKNGDIDPLQRRLASQEAIAAEYAARKERLVAAAEAVYSSYQEIEEVLVSVREAREGGVPWSEMAEHLGGNTPVPVLGVKPEKGAVLLGPEGHEVQVLITDTVPQAAQRLYDEAKELAAKVEGARRAMDDTRKLLKIKAEPPKKKEVVLQPAKRRWYHRFRWFRSSDGMLVVGGFDADTNEELVKRYMEKRDVFMHAQAHGAPVVIIKTEGNEVSSTTLEQAAQLAVSCSSAWEAGVGADDAFWVSPEQVSKTPESGEYVSKGSFIVRGERNFIKKVPMRIALGLFTEGGFHVMAAPPSALGNARCSVEIEPGRFARRDAAVKVYRLLVELAGPQMGKAVKKLLSPDVVERLLPRGGSDIVQDSGAGGKRGAVKDR